MFFQNAWTTNQNKPLVHFGFLSQSFRIMRVGLKPLRNANNFIPENILPFIIFHVTLKGRGFSEYGKIERGKILTFL